jgi:hypothetical protein
MDTQQQDTLVRILLYCILPSVGFTALVVVRDVLRKKMDNHQRSGLVICIMGVLMLFAVFYPLLPSPEPKMPLIPEGFSEEALSLPFDPVNSNMVDADEPDNTMIIISEKDDITKLRIGFQEVRSFEGHWAYNDASVITGGILTNVFTPEPAMKNIDWGSALRESWLTAYPYFEVSLPLTEDHRFKHILVTAKMNVLYPDKGPDDNFIVKEENLIRELDLVLILEADESFRLKYDEWQKNHREWEWMHSSAGIAVTTGCISTMVLFGIVLIFNGARMIKKPKMPVS